MGVNFCHPPLLAPPLSRPDPAFAGVRGADPYAELPRVSAVERASFWPDELNPRPSLPARDTSRLFSTVFPRFAVSPREPDSVVREFAVLCMPRFPFTGETPLCRMAFETCACSRSNERPLAAVLVP